MNIFDQFQLKLGGFNHILSNISPIFSFLFNVKRLWYVEVFFKISSKT